MKIGSLFSGLGGLELGLEWSGLGETIWQVEQDEFCQSILAKHWPNVERFSDVKEVGKHNLTQVDCLAGGFPCQDISSAGKGEGLTGPRSSLWFEFARIIRELKPKWVIVENSGSRLDRWVDEVCGHLEDRSYQTLPLPISAENSGAPHRRNRVFVVAYSDSHGYARESTPRLHAERKPRDHSYGRGMHPPRRGDSNKWQAWTRRGGCQPGILRGPNGLLTGVDRSRLKALGNAVTPGCSEIVGYAIQQLIQENNL